MHPGRVPDWRVDVRPTFAGCEPSGVRIGNPRCSPGSRCARPGATGCDASGLVSARFVDNHHQATESYPLNPNGAPFGITSLTTADGRATIIMPHPERVFRTTQLSWAPKEWPEDSPWMRMFRNARVWVG